MTFPISVVSGGTGFVGRFIVNGLIEAGHHVRVIGRHAPNRGDFVGPVAFMTASLGDEVDWSPAFNGASNFIHAAFDHLPGRFRGGEGLDPEGFKNRNINGSEALFKAAKSAGVARAIFLSTRAVYGTQPPGKILDEDTRPHADTLYGEVKLAGERRLQALADARFCTTSLRVTGVYGPATAGREDKWTPMIRSWLAGTPIEPRAGTEVHGRDVSRAVELLLEAPIDDVSGKVFNVSDLMVDNSDILAIVQEATGLAHPLPPAADTTAFNPMATERLKALGWHPGGKRLLQETVRDLLVAVEQVDRPAPAA
ncbi:NAD(P)-dependent oxidoreductase [Tianweitania sp. BSSL-BM11]|uniref:NAD(P)-dependent oxidoreductase n=1 Tax=Tianweitania aestuarii TaxID=2814886 RepID=A0ABS5RVM9_9HYPH|nr:NAD(P)-dependent oxidoreductase [Tianweitania aestuarii]MBS9721042.1 NAD(P)-dependent oxidoreductase [Tianweitania aestuarii]